jgi:hypothetical protein
MNNDIIKENTISDKLLTDQVAKLTNEMTPERDLWSGIERAINHQTQEISDNKKNAVFVPSAWAASILIVMLASWFTFSPSSNGLRAPKMAQSEQEEKVMQGELVSFMQNNFQQQKQTLLVSYGQPAVDTLPVAMQKELKQLGDARASIRKALLADENNADLLNLLDFTQQQELKLLQQLYLQYQVI